MSLWCGIQIVEEVGQLIIGSIAVMFVIVIGRFINHIIELVFIEQFTMVQTIIELVVQCLRAESWRRTCLTPRSSHRLLLLLRLLMALVIKVRIRIGLILLRSRLHEFSRHAFFHGRYAVLQLHILLLLLWLLLLIHVLLVVL